MPSTSPLHEYTNTRFQTMLCVRVLVQRATILLASSTWHTHVTIDQLPLQASPPCVELVPDLDLEPEPAKVATQRG